MKNWKRNAVNMVDNPYSTVDENLHDLINRMNTKESDSEDDDMDEGESENDEFECMNITSINKINNPCLLHLSIEEKNISMEIDCGSAVTVINKRQYFSILDKPIQKYSKTMAVVNGSKLDVLGEVKVLVKFKGKEISLKLLVLDCNNNFIPLLGRP